jgi:4-hydroxy-2-oxoheptanedioate aldolase
MEVKTNPFKAAMLSRTKQIGVWSMSASPVAVEIIGNSGFDWVCIDAEHSPVDISNLMSLLQAGATGAAHQVVRPAWNDPVLLKRVLDVGAQTVLVPFVQNAEEARQAVAACRYPPEGIRGVSGSSRASAYGQMNGYLKKANDEICVLVQLETGSALQNLEEIAQVEGVDGVFIGPSDLAASLGHLGNPGHPDVQNAIQEAIVKLNKLGKAGGILTTDIAAARKYLEWGFTFVASALDIQLLLAGLKNALHEVTRD